MFRDIFENVKRFICEDIFKPASKEELVQRKETRAEAMAKEFRTQILKNSVKQADGTYVYTGEIDCRYGDNQLVNWKSLGFKLSKVIGDISLGDGMESLEGGPEIVDGSFSVGYYHGNSITTLKGAPKIVTGSFSCASNRNIATLEGAPQRVGKHFNASDCRSLASLNGLPSVIGGEANFKGCRILRDISALQNTQVKGRVVLPSAAGFDYKSFDWRKLRLQGGVEIREKLDEDVVVERFESDAIRFLRSAVGKGMARSFNLQLDKITEDDVQVLSSEEAANGLKGSKVRNVGDTLPKFDLKNSLLFWLVTKYDQSKKMYRKQGDGSYRSPDIDKIQLPHILMVSRGLTPLPDYTSSLFKYMNGMKNVLALADMVIAVNVENYNTEELKAQRAINREDSPHFDGKEDEDYAAENRRRYAQLLADKRANVEFAPLVKQILDALMNQMYLIKTGQPTTLTGMSRHEDDNDRVFRSVWDMMDNYRNVSQRADEYIKRANDPRNPEEKEAYLAEAERYKRKLNVIKSTAVKMMFAIRDGKYPNRYSQYENVTLDEMWVWEGFKQAKENYLKTGKISEQDFNDLVSFDPTPSKKYIEWMCKVFTLGDTDKAIMREAIKDFDKIVNKRLITGKETDINQYSNLEKVVDKTLQFADIKTKTEQEKEIKNSGAEKVFENEFVNIYKVLTREASCTYGAGTRWCTAASKSSNYFNRYFYENGVTLYYILKKKVLGNNFDKVAVAVYPDGKKEVYNVQDSNITREFAAFAAENKIPL